MGLKGEGQSHGLAASTRDLSSAFRWGRGASGSSQAEASVVMRDPGEKGQGAAPSHPQALQRHL